MAAVAGASSFLGGVNVRRVWRYGWADLPDGPPEIENSPIRLADKHPALLAKFIQKGLLGLSHCLGTFGPG